MVTTDEESSLSFQILEAYSGANYMYDGWIHIQAAPYLPAMHPTIAYVNISLPVYSFLQQWHCEHWYFEIVPVHFYGGSSHCLTHKLEFGK